MSCTQPPRQVKGVIFDLDGVIFDSRPSVVAFYNHMMEHLGLEPNADQHAEVVHRLSMVDSLKHLLGPEHQHLLGQAVDYWRVMDPMPFISAIELFPHVKETLARLSRDYTLAVATNRTKTATPALDHFGLLQYFRIVLTPTEAGADKPQPPMMDMALTAMALQGDQVVYVGDSSTDEAFCRNTRVALVAFRNPELAAWAHVEDFREIPPLVERVGRGSAPAGRLWEQ